LGFRTFDPIRGKYPDRFTNVGVAEANMIGIAAGMAMRGIRVFCYSIAPFVIFRTLDQIRADLCHMQLPVILVAAGGGLHYAFEGMTHHAIEDIAIARALPGMTVLAPGDPLECEVLMKEVVNLNGPCYLRLGGNNNPLIYEQSQVPKFGEISCLQSKGNIAIIANGEMLLGAKKAMELLKKEGIICRLYSVHTLKPLDYLTIEKIARECSCIITVEEHNIINGIGTAITEILFSCGYRGKFKKLGIPDEYAVKLGSKEWIRDRYGLGYMDIVGAIKSLLVGGAYYKDADFR
jgi:transketolase